MEHSIEDQSVNGLQISSVTVLNGTADSFRHLNKSGTPNPVFACLELLNPHTHFPIVGDRRTAAPRGFHNNHYSIR